MISFSLFYESGDVPLQQDESDKNIPQKPNESTEQTSNQNTPEPANQQPIPPDYEAMAQNGQLQKFDPSQYKDHSTMMKDLTNRITEVDRTIARMKNEGKSVPAFIGQSPYEKLLAHKEHLQNVYNQYNGDRGQAQYNYLYKGAAKPDPTIGERASDFVGNNWGKMALGGLVVGTGAALLNKQKQKQQARGYTGNPIRNVGY